jgi:hypothetical protein
MTAKKVCSKCKLEKNTSEFYSDKRTESGLYSACKSCHYSYFRQLKNKERIRKHQREYRKRRKKTDIRFHEWEKTGTKLGKISWLHY